MDCCPICKKDLNKPGIHNKNKACFKMQRKSELKFKTPSCLEIWGKQ